MLEAHGATVDRETTVARIPGEVVEKAMSTVPHEYTLGARNPEYDLPLDGEHVYISSDGCGVFYRDPMTGEVRSSRKEDLAELRQGRAGARQRQRHERRRQRPGLPAGDARAARVRRLRAEFSEKHSIVVSIKEDWEARSLIKMAEAMAGGKEELKARPMFTTIICTVSPLHQERYGMDLALTLAEAGIPVSFYPMPILGATGPITIAGSAVVNNAEFLSGAMLVQLAHPGAPVMHGGGPTAMYMNSGAYASNSPEAMLLRACQGHMADFYGVPAWYGAGATTAKEPGIQSAYENALAMFMAYANGADVTFGTGLLDGSRILCLENMVVDDEILGMVKRILTGIEVSEETLAVDLIKKMGFNGNYLFDNHTRAHVRELWQAKLGETGNYDGWKNAGAKSTTEKAQEKVAEILAAPAAPFPADLGAEFDAIIAAAAREAAAV